MATHIQIGDISPRIQYTADGVQVSFTYPFPIFTDADVEVYEGAVLATLTTDYAVTGAGNSAGGAVTFTTPPTAAAVVTLKRSLAIKRTTDFQESGEFRAKVINDELDYQTAVLQQVNDDLGRSLRLADTDAAAALTLPDAASRASKYLGFDAQGVPIATDASGPTGPTGQQGPAGNMDGVNNLSELTVPATARANLGLVIGTDVLAPTGDGSGLTGIVSGATVAEKANIMLNAFRIAVNGGLSVQNMVDGVTDEFTDQTGVDLVTSINETWNAAGYYENAGSPVQVLQATGTIIGDMTVSGGVAAAFDGVTAQVATSCADGASAGAYVGKDWGSGNTKTIAQVKTYGSSDLGYDSDINTTNTITILVKGSNDGAAWTTLGTKIFTDQNATNIKTFTTADLITTTAYRYHAVFMQSTASSYVQLAEVQFFEPGVALNMTLVSNAATALAQPDNVFAVLRQQDVDAVTPNTDLTLEASRDGGTTWTAITLAEAATLSLSRVLTGSAVVSAQPVGTAMKWRLKTLNNKSQKIHAVGLEWS